MISNCSGERSFSKLKLTKNDLRSALSQKALNNFALLSSNADKMKSIDFDSLVNDFVDEKYRKKIM